MNGTDLLTEFRERRSEEAFRNLVLRYTNLVYSIAKRRVSNASLAEEITQIVFIRLAKAVPELGGDAELVAWLHRTTVHASIDLWRSESRRRAREQHAVAMQIDPNETVPWNDLAPVLDDAVNDLNDTDRQAIVLRFFNDKSMREVGGTLGVGEDAAKMRVSRALERLRNLLSARGVSCGALALGAMLGEHSVEAAPAHVAANLAALKIPVPAGAALSTPMLVGGVAALLLLGGGLWLLRPAKQTGASVSQNTAPVQADPQASVTTPQELSGTTEATSQDPDPLRLLQVVARARERIASGSMEFQLSMDNIVRGQKETSELRLAALFDGSKLRVESVSREYRYVLMGENAAEISDAKIQELGLDRKGAVQAGLLEGFEAHNVTTSDGSTLLRYRETDGKPEGTTIDDPAKGSGTFVFDPRCLGLRTSLSPNDSVQNCLGYVEAKSVKLVGKEFVEGRVAWHVRVQRKYDDILDFWIDVDQPTRVIKHGYGSDMAISRYQGNSAIPTEVMTSERNGFSKRFVQTQAQFNIPVDAASFTLAGLGMPVGTDVSDYRISRRIGYWTGSGLSDNFPPKSTKTSKAQPPPNIAEMLALLESNPTSHFALLSAIWILLNTPDGPEVEKAAEVIIRDHAQSPDIEHLCLEQDRMRSRSSKKLLQAVLDQNPNADIKAAACFTLATLLKHEAKHGLNKEATAQAAELFDRLIREYPKSDLARRAKPELNELHRLTIGNSAPETEGVDLDGRQLRLSDYRGKVVVLHFWSNYYDEPEQHHKLVESMAGKPFALIGVNSGNDLARAKITAETNQITWPSFFDGRYKGPIHSNWNVSSWPTIFILDQNGVIRYRDVRGFKKLEEAVNSLLR